MDTLIILSILGNFTALSVVIGNGFAAVVMCRYREQLFKMISITYLFQQSVCDVCFGLGYILSPVNFKLLGYEVPLLDADNFVHEYIICKAWSMRGLPLFFVQTSVYNMTLLTVERYLKIVRPMWYKIHITHRKIVLSLVVPWIISFIYSLFFAFMININEDGICNDEHKNETIYSILIISAFITDFCFPLLHFPSVTCESFTWFAIE